MGREVVRITNSQPFVMSSSIDDPMWGWIMKKIDAVPKIEQQFPLKVLFQEILIANRSDDGSIITGDDLNCRLDVILGKIKNLMAEVQVADAMGCDEEMVSDQRPSCSLDRTGIELQLDVLHSLNFLGRSF